jgi:hypothetical protein
LNAVDLPTDSRSLQFSLGYLFADWPLFTSDAHLRAPIAPASIFLVPACAIGAGLVKQSQPDIFPERLLPIEPDRVDLLNFHDPSAVRAFDAQHMALNF